MESVASLFDHARWKQRIFFIQGCHVGVSKQVGKKFALLTSHLSIRWKAGALDAGTITNGEYSALSSQGTKVGIDGNLATSNALAISLCLSKSFNNIQCYWAWADTACPYTATP